MKIKNYTVTNGSDSLTINLDPTDTRFKITKFKIDCKNQFDLNASGEFFVSMQTLRK
jgi:hypothetical protein